MARRGETAETLEQKLLGPFTMEPLDSGGTTTGKLLLRFPDGTMAIFKPASGEAGAVRSKTQEAL